MNIVKTNKTFEPLYVFLKYDCDIFYVKNNKI